MEAPRTVNPRITITPIERAQAKHNMYLTYFVLFLLRIPLTVSTRYGRVRYMKAQAAATIGLELDLSGIGPYVDQVCLLLFLHACRRPAVLTCTAVCTSQVDENDYAMAK